MISKNEINRLKKINLIEYFTETDGDSIRKRKKGEIIHKSKDNIVIYEDHAYVYDDPEEKHPYKDIIGTIQKIYGCEFLEAIERLREYVIVYDLDI